MFTKAYHQKYSFLLDNGIVSREYPCSEGIHAAECFNRKDIVDALSRLDDEEKIKQLNTPLIVQYREDYKGLEALTLEEMTFNENQPISIDFFGNWVLTSRVEMFQKRNGELVPMLQPACNPHLPPDYVIEAKDVLTGDIYREPIYELEQNLLHYKGEGRWEYAAHKARQRPTPVKQEDIEELEEVMQRIVDKEVIKPYGKTILPFSALQDKPKTDKYLGIELEIDGGGESHENAEYIVGHDTHFECKHDGSLDDGFEIVSAPCTVRYHLEEMPWDDIVQKAEEKGYDYEPDSAGMHIHISRKFFKKKMSQRLFGLFINHYHDKLCALFQREIDDYCQPFDEATTDYLYQRNQNVNYTNSDTIEVRFFGSVLSYEHIRAAIQFVDVLSDVVSDEEIQDEFFGVEPDYKYLWESVQDLATECQYHELRELLWQVEI